MLIAGFIAETTFAVSRLVAVLAARFVAVAVLIAGFVAVLVLAIGGLVTVLAARFVAVAVLVTGFIAGLTLAVSRFVAVAVLVTGFIAGLTLAVSRFVAELAARFVECRAVVRREMGIVGGPLTGPLAGRLLRIGSITL